MLGGQSAGEIRARDARRETILGALISFEVVWECCITIEARQNESLAKFLKENLEEVWENENKRL